MAGAPQPDYVAESRVVEIPVWALVEMRESKGAWVDPQGQVLSLGHGDLIEVMLPPFQRGLKWDEQRLSDFHESLIQGWPIGLVVLAAKSSRLINKKTGQRRHTLLLIDGQQRSWALAELTRNFWTRPWYNFASPKWDVLPSPAGSIIDAGRARDQLANTLKVSAVDVERAIASITSTQGQTALERYPDFLKALCAVVKVDPESTGQPAEDAAKNMADSLRRQFEEFGEIKVPALLLAEALEPQLPSIFRRLNEGVPLKGYDLLAAMWEGERLTPGTDARRKKALADILDVARRRISSSYEKPGSGYTFDPNLESLEAADLSLFDLLYFLSRSMSTDVDSAPSSDVLAFQISALVLAGSIGKVDDLLRKSFPVDPVGGPDITNVPKLYQDAWKHVLSALKPMLDVSSSTLQLRGRLGLTPTVVYASTFLTHHNRVVAGAGGHLEIRARTASADDKLVEPGVTMTSGERLARLTETLPAWFVHDALTSTFAGSRAYEAVNKRIWSEFSSGSAKSRRLLLEVSNEMLVHPSLDSMLSAFDRLWSLDLADQRTPQRRRISEAGSVLYRAAFSHLPVHDTVIDHVIPFSIGVATAKKVGKPYALNHIGNLMPLDKLVNGMRGDQPWDKFQSQLKPQARSKASKAAMVDWADTSTGCLRNPGLFNEFLSKRYRALVSQALTNLEHPEWLAVSGQARASKMRSIAIPP